MSNQVTTPQANQKLIRRPTVTEITGLGRSQMYDQISKGLFPKPIKIGARSSAWIESEVDEWIQKRIAESRKTTTQAA